MADQKVVEKIEIMLHGVESMEFKEFIDKVQDIYLKNQHRAFEKFTVSLVQTKELGWIVCFNGERPETQEEKTKREAEELGHRKQVEEAEIKEFLRLQKKYGKK